MLARWLALFAACVLVGCTTLADGDPPDASATSDASDEDDSSVSDEGDASDRDDASSEDSPDAAGDGDGDGDGDASDLDAADDETADASPDADVVRCEPLSERSCYSGPEGTIGHAACKAGTEVCNEDGTGYGPCEGEVVPAVPSCSESFVDVDCNDLPDNAQDLDGDGYTLCDNDCCDSPAHGCDDPELVNPGAYDYPGDELDDNCSGNAAADIWCDDVLASNSINAMDYAAAMDLCQITTAGATGAERTWGMISASFSLANGTGTPNIAQHAIRPSFGGTSVRHGMSMVALSSGAAAATGQVDPAPAALDPGPNYMTMVTPPADWLAANGGQLPRHPSCPPPITQNLYDSAMITMTMRVPTNARALSLDVSFLSAEFPEWVCSAYNDYFVALLDTAYDGAPANHADKNIAVYVASGGARHPLGVNLAYANTGLFTQCVNGTLSCAAMGTPSTINTCGGTSQLVGTGFDAPNANQCNANSLTGGSTGWLRIAGNVVPGETITLRFALWDTGDATVTSTVLLDKLRWLRSNVSHGVQLD